MHAGDSCWNKGNYPCSQINYKEALKLKPTDPQVNKMVKMTKKDCSYWYCIRFADVMLYNKDYTHAQNMYSNALEFKPRR